MTTKPQSTTEPPDRIRVCIRAGKEDWIGVAYAAETDDPSTIHEYVRVDRKYFCSCGAALTAEEYITHYFEMGHDRGDPAVAASAAPVVDNNDLISRAGAKAAMCNMCANQDRYKPAEPLEGSMRLFHFQRSDNWNAGQCLAQAIDSVPAAAATAVPVEQPEVANTYHHMAQRELQLVKKILAAVEREEESRFGKGTHGISEVIHSVCAEEGIKLESDNEEAR